MENPIKMDDSGVPLFLETPISSYIFISGLSSPRNKLCTSGVPVALLGKGWEGNGELHLFQAMNFSVKHESSRFHGFGSRNAHGWEMVLGDLDGQLGHRIIASIWGFKSCMLWFGTDLSTHRLAAVMNLLLCSFSLQNEFLRNTILLFSTKTWPGNLKLLRHYFPLQRGQYVNDYARDGRLFF